MDKNLIRLTPGIYCQRWITEQQCHHLQHTESCDKSTLFQNLPSHLRIQKMSTDGAIRRTR